MGDIWGISRPFEVAFCAFLLSALYVAMVVPYIDASTISSAKKARGQGISQLFTPLRVLLPQRILSRNGTVTKHYGLMVLCAGIFLGVVCLLPSPPVGVSKTDKTTTAGNRICAAAYAALCHSQV